ncbi:MAG: carboxy terminal-processing peptidase [Pseudomonadales bacterium]|nr:carboxy terminal-processing peptidase [Pseudomonadales bacterium]
MSRIILGALVAFAAFAPLSNALATTVEPLEPLPVHANTTRNIVDALASRHYVTTELDDHQSERIFDGYLDDLDPSKSYLLASDVAEFSQYRDSLDNLLRRGDVEPAFEIFNRYHLRVVNRFDKVIAMLQQGIDQFDFTKDESLELDRKEAHWATDMAELDDLWRKRVKNAILNLKLAGKDPKDIQDLLIKRYQNRLSRTVQTNSEDVFQLYMNSFTRTYDPHTQYFSPQTSENFNINMSLSLEGIGAVLQREDEYTKVVSLVPAGPADKSKQIFPNDKIVAVGQGEDGEMVDVIGWRLDEVVQLIRGKKDTIVRLDVIPAKAKDQAESKVVAITRNTVKLEEQSAKAEVIDVEQFGAKHKIGVIRIPTFYIDFKAYQQGDKDFKSTTRDVRELLTELMGEGVEGIVIDLRDNGGGSLQEARTLTGLFIDRGPTVQIRSKSNRVDILNDRDIRTVYDGPLAVLVNRLSASASEIFAGAIQDYQRGVIIGSQTFGKGTVQSLLPLNRGQLKLTQAKFYRITGESTQHKGILPDISYPADYDPDSIGESTLDSPLPWDKIQPTTFRPKNSVAEYLPDLRNLHEARVSHDPEFEYQKDANAYRQKLAEEKDVTLNEEKRKEEKESEDKFWLTLENTRREAEGLAKIDSLDELKNDDEPTLAQNGTPSASGGGITSPDEKSADGKSSEGGIKGNEMAGVVDVPKNSTPTEEESGLPEADKVQDKPDAYLVESSNILVDLISLTNRTAAKKAENNQI